MSGSTIEQMTADVGAATSVAAAGYAWLGTANEVVQIIAGIVAAVAGCAAAWYHTDKTLAARRDRKDRETRSSSSGVSGDEED